MDAPKVRYIPNPRFNADGIPVYFGSSQDSRILYDAANDEWTLQTKDAGGTFQDRMRVEGNTNTPDVDLVDNPVKWSSGRAVTAADYSIGRDADGTNQLHINVPTGATVELSVNDAAEAVLSATDFDLKNNTLSNVGAAGSDWTSTQLVMSNAAGPSIQNEAVSATNPTLIPRKTALGTGIGSNTNDQLNFIVNSVNVIEIAGTQTNFKNHEIANIGAGGNDWTATLLSLQDTANLKIGATTARAPPSLPMPLLSLTERSPQAPWWTGSHSIPRTFRPAPKPT